MPFIAVLIRQSRRFVKKKKCLQLKTKQKQELRILERGIWRLIYAEYTCISLRFAAVLIRKKKFGKPRPIPSFTVFSTIATFRQSSEKKLFRALPSERPVKSKKTFVNQEKDKKRMKTNTNEWKNKCLPLIFGEM